METKSGFLFFVFFFLEINAKHGKLMLYMHPKHITKCGDEAFWDLLD